MSSAYKTGEESSCVHSKSGLLRLSARPLASETSGSETSWPVKEHDSLKPKDPWVLSFAAFLLSITPAALMAPMVRIAKMT
jgi:hypothetical protein